MNEDDEALHAAIRGDDVERVRAALQRGARSNAIVPHFGTTMLAVAARVASPAIVSELLAHGATPNPIPEASEAPLDCAADGRKDAGEKVRLLLSAGADPNGLVALNVAAQRGDDDLATRIATLLLDAGADPNHADPQSGWTALAHATCSEHASLVALLVERGARADCPIRFDERDADLSPGTTAIQIARSAATHYMRDATVQVLGELGVRCAWKAIDDATGGRSLDRESVIQAAARVAREAGDHGAVELLDSPEGRAMLDETLAGEWSAMRGVEVMGAILAHLSRVTPSIAEPVLDRDRLVGQWVLVTRRLPSGHGGDSSHFPLSDESEGGFLAFRDDGTVDGRLEAEDVHGRFVLEDGALELELDSHEPQSATARFLRSLERLEIAIDDDTGSRAYGLTRAPERH